MLKNLYTKIAGDPSEKTVKDARVIVEAEINPFEPELEKLSDAELRAKTDEFKAHLAEAAAAPRRQVAELREQLSTAADAEDRQMIEEQIKLADKALVDAERAALDEILPEAFACVREASKRTIGLRHFDVQMIGGMVLHKGQVAEMKTGEGKTLVATLPLYLNALTGHGTHLITVNDYLARLHTQLMGPVYAALGLSVGTLQQGEQKALMFDPSFKAGTRELDSLRSCTRQEAYRADITYGTNSEFGFDYLRDNMAWRLEERVQRELYYAIVDEVDNILIDEARTPLIISGPAGEASEEYYRLAELVRKLNKDHYEIDQRTRGITLTEAGYDRVEELLGRPLYSPDRPEESDPQQAKVMHHLEAALKAEYLFKRDKDYIVRKGQVIIVDEFTGRLMAGRRWSDGLHQAVEAKERVAIQQESVTYATVTLQNYFRLYKKIAGMTGTAKTEEEELQKVYGLDVVVIPTNKPMIRSDQPDQVYRNEEAKWRAVTIENIGLYARGQPTLIGTTSVELSERLSKRFAAPKLQLLARVRLIASAVETSRAVNDKQRGTLKSILSRSLDDAPENYDEALSSRLFHEYDLRAVGGAMRKLGKEARELARVKARLGAKGAKDTAALAKQFSLRENDLRELEDLDERDLKFAARLEERDLRPESVEALLAEISAHPDDMAKTAQKFNVALDVAMSLYQDTRLSRAEMGDINRALIDSLGSVDDVQDADRVRAADMETIVKRLFLRDEDVTRLAKKLEVNADPFTDSNIQMLGEMFMVEDATVLSDILHLGIPHNVLNAKEHEKEGGIIARAGELHAITLATNMAGRGVDIKLGGELPEQTLNEVGRVLRKNGVDPYDLTFDQIKDALNQVPPESYALDREPVETFLKYMSDRAKVRELGGLRIIGTERHEARRIDNQLRGRSGRQGDPGSSRFYVSLEDEIMRRMGGKGLVDRVWVEDIPIEHSWVTGAIEQAQVKMESYNFDIRKHLLEYDDVLNKQREVIYGQRYRILTKADLREDLSGWLEEELGRVIVEDLKADHGESRLLLHLDALLPGFYMNENALWPPFSLELVQRSVMRALEPGGKGAAKDADPDGRADGLNRSKEKILDAAQEAMELNRDFLSEVIIPEIVNTFEQQYRTTWDEIEDIAKNTLKTIQEEAGEQNRRLDARTLTTTIGQSVGLSLDVRPERAGEIGDHEIMQAVRRAYDARVVDQVYHRTGKRAGLDFEFHWRPEGALDFGALREELATAMDEAYTKIAEKHLVEIERELDERAKSIDDLGGKRLAYLLFGISNTRQAAFDQRTHRRIDLLVPRFPWVHLAATQLKQFENDALRGEILAYWNQSLQALEPLRGGVAGFNDLLRELMLSVVTNLWVDYLTAIESLREGIGLQAFGQRDPLVEYKRRAYEMFQDLYARIRSQVVSYVFTYQYRGFAKLEEEDRDRAARQVVEAAASTPAITGRFAGIAEQKTNGGNGSDKPTGTKQKAESKKTEPPRKPIGAPVGTKLGRNDPCWCGSGKKYKNCHMQSDMK